jgi:ASPIC and UnbV/FG-GAP-like repeat/IPTL-CTERM motif
MNPCQRTRRRAFVRCLMGLIAATTSPDPARAGGPSAFTEEAVSRGVQYVVSASGPDPTHEPFGAGVAFADLDNDRDPDLIVVGNPDGSVGVFENDGTGQFTRRTGPGSVPDQPYFSGVTAADYDGDGDLDLFFSNYLAANVLMRNDGGFQFTDVTTIAGLGDAGAGTGCAWGDVDGDTWLDLFVPNRTIFGTTIPNRMYINNQDGTFTEVGETLGINRGDDPTYVVAFMDIDRDGDADLYLGNDKGTNPDFQNHLFQNQGDGTFVDVTEATNTAANVDCMGIAVGDWTRNGWQDLYVTNIPPGNVLLLNQGGGVCVDATTTAGVGSFEIGWGTFFFDYDNDGWEELYVCNMLGPNRLYNYDGTWPTTDQAPALGVAVPETSYCTAFADIDADGDLDFAVTSTGSNVQLFVNNEGQTRRWIRFNITGEGANLFAVGAQIDLRVGSVWQMREIFNGSNYKSQNEMTVHFGVDTATVVNEVRVTWPSGTTITLNNLATNFEYEIGPSGLIGGGPVPTMSQWGLTVLSLLFVTAGTLVFRRRIAVA